jgi:hypothetical protein
MNIMAPKKENDELPKKRIVEFDMFVRDLEPEQHEKIRGGGKTANQHKPDDSKIDGSDGADFARLGTLRDENNPMHDLPTL